MPAIYHEGSWLGNATDPEVLVKDTVGWTGKNRAYSQTNNAVIAHIENGITYDVSWTGSATVTLKKNSASGATITSGSTSPLSFTADADYELYFGSSATVTNIMVKDSRITDPTYEPYHESVEVMYEEEIHGVNLLKNTATSTTTNGITFTVNSDGTIKANGTATADVYLNISKSVQWEAGTYILSGGVSDNVRLYFKDNPQTKVLAWDKGDSPEFTVSDSLVYNCAIYVKNGYTANNVTLKPMIRKADIEDSTYRPYNPQAIQNQLNAQGVLGAKNLLQNTATSQTINGVTFTVNADKSVTANGTATATADFAICSRSDSSNPNVYDDGKYIGSGCPSGGSASTYMMYFDTNNADGSLNRMGTDVGDGVEFTITNNGSSTYPSNRIQAIIRISKNKTVSNLTFYPMLRLASDPDDTYQPYAMTNKELTEEKINIADLKTVVSASSDFADFKTRIASL